MIENMNLTIRHTISNWSITNYYKLLYENGYFLPEDMTFGFQVFLITIYCVIITLSLFGNIIVLFVILVNKPMRTTTNVFLVSLAISDILIVSWNMPMMLLSDVQNEWRFGEPLCKFTNYLQAVNILASIITLTVVSVERYYAICHPLRARHVRTAKRAGVCVFLVWIVALAISLPMLWIQRQGERLAIRRNPAGNSSQVRIAFVCEEWYRDEQYDIIHSYFLFTMCYFVPIMIMFAAYGKIAYKLWVRQPIGEAKSFPQYISRTVIQKKRIIRMLIILVVVFGFCWLPFFSVMLYHLYHDIDTKYRITMSIIKLIGYSNSLWNPIIYGFMNETFQMNFKNMCFKCKKRLVAGNILPVPQSRNNTTESIL